MKYITRLTRKEAAAIGLFDTDTAIFGKDFYKNWKRLSMPIPIKIKKNESALMIAAEKLTMIIKRSKHRVHQAYALCQYDREKITECVKIIGLIHQDAWSKDSYRKESIQKLKSLFEELIDDGHPLITNYELRAAKWLVFFGAKRG